MTVTQKMRKDIISMIEIEMYGEKIKIKDWHERLADAKKKVTPSDGIRKILNMSPEELDEYHKKSVAEVESNFFGSEERLAYYRSHGLSDCSDYPGGDAAFERDVLAGNQREERHPFTFILKREDEYIYKCIEDGRFKIDWDFRHHFHMHPKLILIVEHTYEKIYFGMYQRSPEYEKSILSPDSDWYNDKPSVCEVYCPYPTFPSSADDE